MLFKGEQVSSPKIDHLVAPIKADQSLNSYAFESQSQWYGITLTAGDTPIVAYIDAAGVPHIIVATSGAALAIRS